MINTQKVLIVDDEQRFRQGLRTLLNFYNVNSSLFIEIVGEAASLEQVLKLTIEHNPNIILLDLELVSCDGVSVLVGLKEISYAGKVLVLSGHKEDNWIYRAMQAGAAGYIFKSRLATQLYEAIDKVIKSEVYLPTEVVNGFFRHFQAYSESYFKARKESHLTKKEQEVLHWLAQGASNEEIAKNLYVTVATVKAHLTSIFLKLKVTSRTQAIVTAIKLGLVPDCLTEVVESQ